MVYSGKDFLEIDNSISKNIDKKKYEMKPERLSNIELLRIIAMFMIIAVHADYWLFGMPDKPAISGSHLGSGVTRIFIEQLSIVGVNIFVGISGWFGIRPSAKSLLSFIFQILFFLISIYFIGVIVGLQQFSIKTLSQCFLFTHHHWFIKAYLALYIIAPVLNIYISNINRKQLLTTIFLLLAFELVYGWTGSAAWIQQGYSLFSFITLYLLLRYISIYNPTIVSVRQGVVIYLASSIFATIISCVSIRFNLPGIAYFMISYVNPLVIIGACGLLIGFANLHLGCKPLINKIARSTFAVYLFPVFFIFDFIYQHLIRYIYDNYDGIIVVAIIFIILLATFAISILADQIRIFVWNIIWPKIENIINNK